MLRSRVGWGLVASLILVLNLLQQGVAAQAVITTPPEKSAAPASQSETRVQGFRSARFRMTEAEVLKAIQDDFQITKEAILREVNRVEKTFSRSITVPDLIPDSGPARVAYIFGSESKKLIQVTLFWGKPVNPNPDVSLLIATATLLRNYFAQQGFRKESIVMNGRLEDGTLVVFRGNDNIGNIILLLLSMPQDDGDTSAPKTQEKAVSTREPSLQLSYIQNVRAAEMFKIEK